MHYERRISLHLERAWPVVRRRLLLSGRLRRRAAAGRARRRDDSFMEFYDISHESIISSSGAGLDLNYDRVQPTKITHFVKGAGHAVAAAATTARRRRRARRYSRR